MAYSSTFCYLKYFISKEMDEEIAIKTTFLKFETDVVEHKIIKVWPILAHFAINILFLRRWMKKSL